MPKTSLSQFSTYISTLWGCMLLMILCSLLQPANCQAYDDSFRSVKNNWIPHLHASGEFDVSYINNRALHFTGTEMTIAARLRLQFDLNISHYIGVRIGGRLEQPIGEYSRCFKDLNRYKEYAFEDCYLELRNLPFQMQGKIRIGIVKVPFGIFDTFSIDNINRPLIRVRSREWDAGVSLQTRWNIFDIAIAGINGEGIDGPHRDTNSSKSLSGRVGFVYESESFFRRFAIGGSYYTGNKYSTPIKQPNDHYGADIMFAFKYFSVSGEWIRFEGAPIQGGDLERFDYKYGLFLNQYPTDAEGWYVQLGITPIKRLRVFGFYSEYDPDRFREDILEAKNKVRICGGASFKFHPHIQVIGIYTAEDDPAFVESENLNCYQGDDKYQFTVRVDF